MAKGEEGRPGLGAPLLPQQQKSAPEGRASAWQTFFNIVVSILGTGVLGLPFAFKTAGWLVASLIILLAGVSTFYSMILLVECRKSLEEKGVPEIFSYGDIGALAFGRIGRYATEITILVSQCGGSVAYLVFIGQNLASIFASYHLSQAFLIFLCLTPVEVALSFIRPLSALSPFSAFADLCNVLAMAIVVKRDLQLLPGSFPATKAVTTFSALPFTLGVAVFCFEGLSMTLPLESSMAEPARFPACLARAFSGITLVYIFFGFLGYAAFGDATMDIVTLNLPGGWWSAAVKVGLCVALVFALPIMMHPVHEIIEAKLRDAGSSSTCRWAEPLARGFAVVAMAAVASFVPGFGMFVSLVGSTVCALLSFVFPAALHLKLVGGAALSPGRKALDVFILLFGLAFAAYGAASNVH
ncbi:amino acid transporter ANT1 [Nymphaea colorata]|nr:amino acid transporter ANT1 [Nymphaea colorata]